MFSSPPSEPTADITSLERDAPSGMRGGVTTAMPVEQLAETLRDAVHPPAFILVDLTTTQPMAGDEGMRGGGYGSDAAAAGRSMVGDSIDATTRDVLRSLNVMVQPRSSLAEAAGGWENPSVVLLVTTPRFAPVLIEQLRAFQLETGGDRPVIALVTGGSEEPGGVTTRINHAVDLMQAGAASVLTAGDRSDRINSQLRQALASAVGLFGEAVRRRELQERFDRLTSKERDVLELIEAGRSNRQIAAALDISVRAVEDRRSRAMKRLKAGSLVELIHLLQAVRSRRSA